MAYKAAEDTYIHEQIHKSLSQHNTKPFWRYIKSKKQDNVGVSPLLKDGKLEVDSKPKAEILLSQFSSVFSTLKTNIMPDVSLHVEESLNHIKIDQKGTEKLLRNLNISKASGPDSIPNIVLKECAAELSPVVTHIFQKSIDSGTLPEDWTSANIAPIYKKGDRHRAENYRPVSLTSVLSKVLEHIIVHSLLEHFDKNKVLSNLNHGFRSGYSCETQLAVTMDELTQNHERGDQTDIIILDFSKAFDMVPHKLLLHKLESYGIRGSLIKWLEHFLTKRSMRVVVEGEFSKDADVLSGVPQGTVLGPILFLVHINDLPECVSSSVRLFADDCLLYRVIKSYQDHLDLQKDLKNLENWATKWGMKMLHSPGQKENIFYVSTGQCFPKRSDKQSLSRS